MSKLLAVFCTCAVHVASVAIREHSASSDPHVLLESMRALAKEAVLKKINSSTLEAVRLLVDEMQAQVNTSLEECAAAENRLCMSAHQRTTEINSQLSRDVGAIGEENDAILDTVANALNESRVTEGDAHLSRMSDCDKVCQTLSDNPPCTPPALPDCDSTAGDCGWLADVEPCCGTEVDQELVPNTPSRSTEWDDLESYMTCLDNWMEHKTTFFSAYDDFHQWARECRNSSETWKNQKDNTDPFNGNVARDMCSMIDNDVNKCTRFMSNWTTAMNILNAQVEASQVIIENGLQQYEAMRKIDCLFQAISQTDQTGAAIQQACEACENQPPQCQPWCAGDGTTDFTGTEWAQCPQSLLTPMCCLNDPVKNDCTSRHKCDVCTSEFRTTFYNCPADGSCPEASDDLDSTDLGDTTCTLLIQQMSCDAMSCEDECKELDEGCGVGWICKVDQTTGTLIPGEAGRDRVSYNEFNCGIVGNEDFE